MTLKYIELKEFYPKPTLFKAKVNMRVIHTSNAIVWSSNNQKEGEYRRNPLYILRYYKHSYSVEIQEPIDNCNAEESAKMFIRFKVIPHKMRFETSRFKETSEPLGYEMALKYKEDAIAKLRDIIN